MKKCTKCEKEKPLWGFPRDNARQDGHNSICTECRDSLYGRLPDKGVFDAWVVRAKIEGRVHLCDLFRRFSDRHTEYVTSRRFNIWMREHFPEASYGRSARGLHITINN